VSSFRRLLPYLIRYRLRYLGGAVCLLLATAASVSVPETLPKRLAVVISGASPSKRLREIGELEIESEVPQ